MMDPELERRLRPFKIAVNMMVDYWSGSGRHYLAIVADIPTGQNANFPPTVSLQFRDERGKLVRKARVLHWSAASGRARQIWDARSQPVWLQRLNGRRGAHAYLQMDATVAICGASDEGAGFCEYLDPNNKDVPRCQACRDVLAARKPVAESALVE